MTTYRASFEYTGTANGSPAVQAKRYTVLGFGVNVIRSFQSGKLFYIDFQIVTPFDSSNAVQPQNVPEATLRTSGGSIQPAVIAAVPVAAIAMGIIVVAGLAALYYNFKEVHEIVESPQGSLLALALVAIAGVILWKQIK